MRAAPIFMRVAAAKAQEYSMGRGSKLPDGRCSRQSQQSRRRGSSLLKGMIDDDAERSDGGDNVPVSLKSRRTHERVFAPDCCAERAYWGALGSAAISFRRDRNAWAERNVYRRKVSPGAPSRALPPPLDDVG